MGFETADPRLTEHVAAIHELSKRIIADVIDTVNRPAPNGRTPDGNRN
jgi:hypothetical protein